MSSVSIEMRNLCPSVPLVFAEEKVGGGAPAICGYTFGLQVFGVP